MKNKISQTLFALSETDKDIKQFTEKKSEIETKRGALFADLSRSKERLQEIEALHKDASSRQGGDEHRLKDEEAKIIERRKQLTALGGAKSAKLVERELDIASRVLESLEKTALEAMESAERLNIEMTMLKGRVHELEVEFEDSSSGAEKDLSELVKKLGSLDDERQVSLSKLDDRLRNLYQKVNARYPGAAVAVARSGACRSCYRALPAQTFNQVMAGNLLIQCPGCSRILVYTDEG